MKIAVVGCGNMGAAYISSLLKQNMVEPDSLFLYDLDEEKLAGFKKQGAVVSTSFDNNIKGVDFLILAVKPQYFKEVASSLVDYTSSDTVSISIMAGVNINTIQDSLGTSCVVRAMPNTPCQLGKGVTGYIIEGSLDASTKDNVVAILSATGKIVEVENEDDINAVTALSGSGPAYYFNFVKAMVDAGIEMGMSQEQSTNLVQETMLGAYHLMTTSEDSLDVLIDKVTSKGGTTEAALNVMHENNLIGIVKKALIRARDRGRELAKG